jgi:serine/threonine-protein kinase
LSGGVLVVDDNSYAAETLSALLAESGHHVTVAHDGPVALKLSEQHPVDVAILDTQEASFPPAGGERPPTRKPGEIIAEKYRLVRFLARGGMAEVWLGTHVDLKTEVAIKFADPHVTGDCETGPLALERFRFEAQLSARLAARTRHVVAVQDAGTHLGAPYLVMEYVPGRTLEAEVEAGGPLSPARFALVLDQVADALGAAHAMGVVHRDLKPSNLLLVEGDEEGMLTVKVADFGVAKALSTELAVDRPRATQQGQLVGSPAFMSPEQLRGATEIDARSDVWSLGVVAYEMLTGQPCFEGATVIDVFAAISAARYRPASSVRPDLPRGIDAFLARALAFDPARRFASVEEMAGTFRALVERPARSRRPLVAAAALAAGVLAAVLVARGRPAPSVNAPSIPPTAVASTAPAVLAAPPSTSVASPAPVDAPDLPPAQTVPPRRAARPVAPLKRPPVPAPAETVAPITTAVPVATVARATTEPPKPPAPPVEEAPRPLKRIDPSEIQ